MPLFPCPQVRLCYSTHGFVRTENPLIPLQQVCFGLLRAAGDQMTLHRSSFSGLFQYVWRQGLNLCLRSSAAAERAKLMVYCSAASDMLLLRQLLVFWQGQTMLGCAVCDLQHVWRLVQTNLEHLAQADFPVAVSVFTFFVDRRFC